MNKQLERELIEGRRILNTQERVIEDEMMIMRSRIKNYIKTHKTDLLEDIFMSIYMIGREHQRLEFYENTVMNTLDKVKANQSISEARKRPKKSL